MHTTNEVVQTRTAGGVARNVAHQLSLLDIPVQLISVFIRAVYFPVTGKYTALIDKDGSLFTAMLTNAALYLVTPEYLQQQESLLSTAAYILVDANLSIESINWLIQFSNLNKIRMIVEPASVPPAKKIAACNFDGLYLITPNEDELPALCTTSATTTEEQVEELLQKGIQYIWLHRGKQGSALYKKTETLQLNAPNANVVDCTGAGDGSVSGFILSKYFGKDNLNSLRTAHTLSAEILQVQGAIATHLNQEKLLKLVSKYYEE